MALLFKIIQIKIIFVPMLHDTVMISLKNHKKAIANCLFMTSSIVAARVLRVKRVGG